MIVVDQWKKVMESANVILENNRNTAIQDPHCLKKEPLRFPWNRLRKAIYKKDSIKLFTHSPNISQLIRHQIIHDYF